ncbi:MAG: exosortase-associated EpsI family protein [Gemmataceae bacterium]
MNVTSLLRSAAAVLVFAGLLVGGTVVHGLRTERWGKAAALGDAARALESVTREFGDWEATDVKLDDRQLQIGEIAGYLCRDYVHRPTGERVLVLVVCGRPGAVGAHSPEVCYRGAGYATSRDAAKEVVKGDGPPAEFHTASATKQGARAEKLAIAWTFSTDRKRWSAPETPRWTFALSPVLYKLYLVRQVAPDGREEAADAAEAVASFRKQMMLALK